MPIGAELDQDGRLRVSWLTIEADGFNGSKENEEMVAKIVLAVAVLNLLFLAGELVLNVALISFR
jgi:hypothetical protein